MMARDRWRVGSIWMSACPSDASVDRHQVECHRLGFGGNPGAVLVFGGVALCFGNEPVSDHLMAPGCGHVGPDARSLDETAVAARGELMLQAERDLRSPDTFEHRGKPPGNGVVETGVSPPRQERRVEALHAWWWG